MASAATGVKARPTAQAARDLLGPFDGGVGLSGLLLRPDVITMPYLQLGRISDGGSGWYTTQGVLLMEEDEGSILDERGAAGVAWVPAIAYQRATDQGTAHLFVMGAFRQQCRDFCDPRDSRWVLATGVTVEYPLRPRPRPAARR